MDEIIPEGPDILTIWLVQLWLFMSDKLTIIARIKCPAVEPAQVQGALGAVEVATNVGFLSIISSIEAMLPGGGIFFERERSYLCIGSITGIFTDMSPANR